MKKREFLKFSAAFAATGIASTFLASCTKASKTMMPTTTPPTQATLPATGSKVSFELPPLPYGTSALEPFIDQKTMEIHHDKHHAGYVKNLNAATEKLLFADTKLESILANVTSDQAAIRNNGGGHWNHSLYWRIMQPGGAANPTQLEVGKAIIAAFGSYEQFAEKFTGAAKGIFGSGWAWLSLDANKKLFISTTPNQDNPLMKQLVKEAGTPILGIDIWEHAYYLKHQNKRADYVTDFMKVINWDIVNENYRKV